MSRGLLLALVVCVLLNCQAVLSNATGTTHSFIYGWDKYIFNIDNSGSYDIVAAQMKCLQYGASLVDVRDNSLLAEIYSQVGNVVPNIFGKVTMWTAGSGAPGTTTNIVLTISRTGTGIANKKSAKPQTFKCHGYVCKKPGYEPGTTHNFMYGQNKYFFNVGYAGTYDIVAAQSKCLALGANLVDLPDADLLAEIYNRVGNRVPYIFDQVTMWTADIGPPGTTTNIVLTIARNGTGLPNTREAEPQAFKSHGYVCKKPGYELGTTHHFIYNGDDYYFNIDHYGVYDVASSQAKCNHLGSNLVLEQDHSQLSEIRRQVSVKIPHAIGTAYLWTGDSNAPGTNVIMAISRPEVSDTYIFYDRPPHFKIHGYICHTVRAYY